jgi:hypothetical protein
MKTSENFMIIWRARAQLRQTRPNTRARTITHTSREPRQLRNTPEPWRDDWAVWYGFGLEFVMDNNGAVRNYYKDGANAGASGIVRYYPADRLDVVVLSNSADGAWPPIDEIHRLIRAGNPSIGESGVGFR